MSIPQLKDGEQVVYFKAGGEWCYIWTPTDYKRNGSTPVVIHHHGARGYIREGESDWLDTESKIAFLKAVREGGKCVIAVSHARGDHWGNSCAVDANAALLRALDECKGIDTSRLGFMGGGLGGTLIWNSILGPFAGRVKIVMLEPLLIVFLGVIIGGIVLCMFLPIFKMGEIVGGG